MVESRRRTPNHARVSWRPFAILVLICMCVTWAAIAWIVWAATILIISFRHDGMAPADRIFLMWAPAGVLFLAPAVLSYLVVLVLGWRRPGWRAMAASFAVGCCVLALVGSTALWFGLGA